MKSLTMMMMIVYYLFSEEIEVVGVARIEGVATGIEESHSFTLSFSFSLFLSFSSRK